MEKSLSDAQHRLSVKMSELQAAHEQIETLELRMSELDPLWCILALFVCTSVLMCFRFQQVR